MDSAEEDILRQIQVRSTLDAILEKTRLDGRRGATSASSSRTT